VAIGAEDAVEILAARLQRQYVEVHVEGYLFVAASVATIRRTPWEPAPTPSTSTSSDASAPLALVVGAVVGVALLAAVVAVVLRRRRSKGAVDAKV
jgi:multisubunit Na+/H+ antiporter MnhC subunit